VRGYLLREQAITPGTDTFIECPSEENNFAVVFEDDTDTGYFYALEIDPQTSQQRILDALHIYQVEEEEKPAAGTLKIIWSTDWLKCALIIDNKCHAVFDFESQGGYNRSEFPPPNETWTKGGRELREELVLELFK
jgi:hypothetical protein